MEVNPGYKRTEVGVIPEDWSVSTVGEEFTVQLGKMLDAERNVGVAKPYLGNKAVQWYWIDIKNLPTVPMSRSDLDKFRLKKGDLLVCEGGEVGRAAIWDAPLDECYFQKALHRLRPTRDYEPRLLVALLHHLSQSGALANYVTQTSIAHLPREKFIEVPIPRPPLPEQRAIAAALSDVDALLEGLTRLIAKKRDLKQAAMQQLLTGQTRLPGFRGTWEVKRLGEVAEIVMGQSPSSLYYNTRGDGLPLIQGNADVDNRKTIKRVFTTHITKRGRQGDILMSVRAPVGEISRATFDVCVGRGVCAIGFPNDYLYQLLIFLEPTWVRHSKGSTFDSVNSSDVNAVDIQLPVDPAEQTTIAAVLSDMDIELDALEARRDKIGALKQAVMQELLTGRTRLVRSGTKPSQQLEAPPRGRKANVYFRRSVLAAEIIDQLHDQSTFGHVKFEKVMFLVEHLCGVDTGSTYRRKAAGPYDNRALRSIDSQLRKQQWFDARKVGGRYRYVPMQKRGGHRQYFDRYFSNTRDTFERILGTFKTVTWERCEIVATLLAAWSDLLQEHGIASDEAIVHEVLNNWHESKQRISRERWLKALDWMRKEGFVPKGVGSP